MKGTKDEKDFWTFGNTVDDLCTYAGESESTQWGTGRNEGGTAVFCGRHGSDSLAGPGKQFEKEQMDLAALCVPFLYNGSGQELPGTGQLGLSVWQCGTVLHCFISNERVFPAVSASDRSEQISVSFQADILGSHSTTVFSVHKTDIAAGVFRHCKRPVVDLLCGKCFFYGHYIIAFRRHIV